MNAITARYFPPGPKRGPRIRVSNGDYCAIIKVDPRWSYAQNQIRAVRAFCRRRGWKGTLVEGWLSDGVKSCKVYLWLRERQAIAPRLRVR